MIVWYIELVPIDFEIENKTIFNFVVSIEMYLKIGKEMGNVVVAI